MSRWMLWIGSVGLGMQIIVYGEGNDGNPRNSDNRRQRSLEQGKEGKTMRLNCGDNWYLEQKMEHGVIVLYEKKTWGHRLSTVTNSWTEIISALQTLLKKGEKKDA